MPRPPLPTRLLRAFRDRSSNASADRIPHARNLEQVERLLDRAPVFLGNENSVAAFSSDVDRLVCLRGLIEEPVQLPPGLACRHRAHRNIVSASSVRDYVRVRNLAGPEGTERPIGVRRPAPPNN